MYECIVFLLNFTDVSVVVPFVQNIKEDHNEKKQEICCWLSFCAINGDIAEIIPSVSYIKVQLSEHSQQKNLRKAL